MTDFHHTYQHRLERKHNTLLLFIPGLVFVTVIALYLIVRILYGEPAELQIQHMSFGIYSYFTS